MIFSEEVLVSRGKELSWLLRHDKSYKFDKHGWRSIKDLVDNHGFSEELLEEIVKTNDKQRYEYNATKDMLRARQGHSVDVDVELKEVTPPDVLYHGTSKQYKESILKKGLQKQTRLYVHLSDTIETATSVGLRHAKSRVFLCIFSIDGKAMSKDGYKFYKSNNGVYLVDSVPSKYLKIIS